VSHGAGVTNRRLPSAGIAGESSRQPSRSMLAARPYNVNRDSATAWIPRAWRSFGTLRPCKRRVARSFRSLRSKRFLWVGPAWNVFEKSAQSPFRALGEKARATFGSQVRQSVCFYYCRRRPDGKYGNSLARGSCKSRCRHPFGGTEPSEEVLHQRLPGLPRRERPIFAADRAAVDLPLQRQIELRPVIARFDPGLPTGVE
jgi:hypothetical protein